MAQELATIENKDLTIWEGEAALKEIKDLFAPTLTELEFKGFVNMGKSLVLNPFLKEIWAVKYDKSKPAQIFIGRDGYRVNARRHPQFDYMRVEAVYSNDTYENDNGVINHKFGFANRGTLLGAYCVVKRKDASEPEYRSVLLSEYDKRQGNWNIMKETMIKKVAESQGLRAAFPDKFAGTYSEYEDGFIIEQKPKQSQTDTLNELLAKKGLTHDANNLSTIVNPMQASDSNTATVVQDAIEMAPVDAGRGTDAQNLPNQGVQENNTDIQASRAGKATESQLAIIDEAIHETGFKPDRVHKAFKHYGVKSFADMTIEQADEMIEILNRGE